MIVSLSLLCLEDLISCSSMLMYNFKLYSLTLLLSISSSLVVQRKRLSKRCRNKASWQLSSGVDQLVIVPACYCSSLMDVLPFTVTLTCFSSVADNLRDSYLTIDMHELCMYWCVFAEIDDWELLNILKQERKTAQMTNSVYCPKSQSTYLTLTLTKPNGSMWLHSACFSQCLIHHTRMLGKGEQKYTFLRESYARFTYTHCS